MTDTAPAAAFHTVLLTIDHSTSPRPNGHLIQKFVGSTEDLVTSMYSLLEYYEELHLLQPATLRQFQEAYVSKYPAFIYRTRENVQVVMSAETFSMLVSYKEGNIFEATQLILNTVGEVITNNDGAAGGVVPIVLFSFHSGEAEVEAPAPADWDGVLHKSPGLED